MTSLANIRITSVLVSIGCLVGCHSPRATANPTGSARSDDDKARLSSSLIENPPELPPPNLPPTANQHRKPWIETAQGLRLCAKERVDLAQIFIKFDVNVYMSPEERLLLRSWLDSAFAAAVGQGTLSRFRGTRLQNEMCSDALFCGWLPVKEGEPSAKLLAEFLNAPPLSSFYAAREFAVQVADELYERSTTFRFSALVESIVDGRAARLGANLTKTNALDQLLAAPRVSQLSAAGLTQSLRNNLAESEVTILAPKDATVLAQILIRELAPPSTPRTTPQVEIAFDSPLEIVDERYPESTLYLTWPRLETSQRAAGLAVLDQLASEFQVQRSGTYVRVHRGDSLVKRPGLLISATHELLMQSAEGLASRAKTLWAERGQVDEMMPSNNERDCWSAPSERSSPGSELGDPLIAVWGAKLPQKSEESF